MGFGLLFGLLGGLLNGFIGRPTVEIRPAEVVAWSWMNLGHNVVRFLFLGFLRASLITLLLELVSGLYYGLMGRAGMLGGFLHGWRFMSSLVLIMSFVVLLSGLIGGLIGSLSSHLLDERHRVKPNQGIRQSTRNSLLIGLLSGLVSGLVFGLLFRGVFGVWTVALTIGLVSGLTVGLLSGLHSGGTAFMQHLVLRFFLWRTGSVPWNYLRFLDYAAERILLHKVGGGYIFVHRLLLEYFATLEAAPRPESTTEHEQHEAHP